MLLIFAGIALLFHIWAFLMESLFFMNPKVYPLFGARSAEEAQAVKLMTFNQGFYNLFLALWLLLYKVY